MFGQIRAARRERKSEREKKALQDEINRLKGGEKTPLQELEAKKQDVNTLAEEQKQRDIQAKKEGLQEGLAFLDQNIKGMTPEKKLALQESANAAINRDIQGYERKLLSQQGKRGVTGGAAFAQKQDLARIGTEAQQQTQRDLSQMEEDLKLAKLAALYNIQQGNVTQENLRRQQAIDMLGSIDEKNWQKYLAEQANKLFQKV